MKIRKTHISADSLISKYLPANYTDSFECILTTKEDISADDIMVSFWTNTPKWVDKLFMLRDWIVKPFGIQPGNNRSNKLFEKAIRDNESYMFITVVAKSDNETLIEANDKHLKMYFSVQTDRLSKKEQKVIVSTIVFFHNWLGKAYFFFIYPFHLFIVPSMMKHSIKKLLTRSSL